MLIKKELVQIPLLAFPKTTAKERYGCRFAASAAIYDLKKCGAVLTVDIFDAKTRTLQLRFFSDGSTYICQSGSDWAKRIPKNILGGGEIASTKKDDELVKKFLRDGQYSWYRGYTVGSCINIFASSINVKKRQQAADRKYTLMTEHFNMFPQYPTELTDYCEKCVFPYTYIFISKTEKGYRNAFCGHCGGKYKLKDIKSGNIGVCPKCGIQGKYRGVWVGGEIEDKAKICIAHKIDGQILLRWVNVTRTFSGTEYQYDFYDYYRTLYLNTAKGEVIYSYTYACVMCYGWGWYRKRNGTLNYERAHIYPLNLKEVFGDSYYHVDLQAGLTNAGEISFLGLLDNLKNIPTTEYLFKSGLSAFASNMTADDIQTGGGFSQVLGVSKQYLPLYRKYNIDVHEHRIIQASNTWVDGDSFAKFCALKPERADTSDIIDLLEQMSFERFVNYFTKQKVLLKRRLKFLLIQYKDYISMSKGLKTDLSKKSVRFPKNIKEAHDLILERFNQVKHEIEDENFRQATEKLYSGMTEYTKDSFCIVFPQLRSDLIAEGQSLNHCVGTESYYKNHIAGTKMIFFIRQTAEPDKSYFTMEIDMRELRIQQLYGFGGCSPSAGVRRFANEFLERLQPAT